MVRAHLLVRILRMLLVAVLAATLAACTGGDEPGGAARLAEDTDDRADTSAGEQPLAPAEFTAGHRAAVERYADALEEVQAAGVEAVTADPVGAHEVYDALREATEAALTEFAALTPPGDVAAEYERLVELLEEQVEVLRDAVAASRERDDRTLETHLERYAELLATWRVAYGALSSQSEGG